MDIYLKVLLVLVILFVLCFWATYWQQKSKPEISGCTALASFDCTTTESLHLDFDKFISFCVGFPSWIEYSNELTWNTATWGILLLSLLSITRISAWKPNYFVGLFILPGIQEPCKNFSELYGYFYQNIDSCCL